MTEKFVTINGRKVEFSDERNVLELIRKQNIELPTFCYHSDLSIYGACRLCVVDIDGMGIQASCSIKPAPGMSLKTHTNQLRSMRKMSVELLLASHDNSCSTCERSDSCGLRKIAAQLGIEKVRFKETTKNAPVDRLSKAISRDPNKCILCGDCVRYCAEIQNVGAIDFAYRGAHATVTPAFNKSMTESECVYCGGCAKVCPTGALFVHSVVDNVWKELNDPSKTVVVQIAPAIRVALGEMFDLKDGEDLTGKMTAALRWLGFKKVYDTSFTADLTVLEEAEEFLARKAKNEKLPIFTSCCPAWVKFAEQYLPHRLDNLSTCRSPQQMFGSLVRKMLPQELGIESKNIVSVAIMPCTAKKFEADRPEFATDGLRDVDYVLTTQELAKMIKEVGLDFLKLKPEALDMPFGMASGAGVIFGKSGGVTEAVARYVTKGTWEVTKGHNETHHLNEITLSKDGVVVKAAVVEGLKNAYDLVAKIDRNEVSYDLIEVMSCPGGCVAGAGQPIQERRDTVRARTSTLSNIDSVNPMKSAEQNPHIVKLYESRIGKIGGHFAHEALHTHYHPRKRDSSDSFLISGCKKQEKGQEVKVCVGTSCFLKGSQDTLKELMELSETQGTFNVSATFCMEKCGSGPNVQIGEKVCSNAKSAELQKEIQAQIKK